MSVAFLTLYILAWPVIVAVVLFVIGRAFTREVREAKREGRPLIQPLNSCSSHGRQGRGGTAV